MHLDVQTLSVVTVFVTALLGALLVFAGLQNRSIRAPMWWGAAHIVGASGLGLVTSRGAAPDFVSIDLANALVLLSYGLTWTGARIFDGRRSGRCFVLLAPAIWFLLCRIPAFAADANLRVVVVSTMMAMLALLTAEEFWRGRDEPLMSRWPSVIVLLAYAAVLLARIPATLLSPALEGDSLLSGVSFALLAFGTLLFTVVMAFLLLNLTKERTELSHKINSLIDPLSGVANRRAFLDGAVKLLAQQSADRRAARGAAVRSRSLQADQRPVRSRRRRRGAADRSPAPRPRRSAPMSCSAASAARSSPRCLAGRRPRRGLRHRRPRAAQFRRRRDALRQRRTEADRQRRRHARLRSAGRRARSARDRRRALYRAKELGRNRVETTMPESADATSARRRSCRSSAPIAPVITTAIIGRRAPPIARC